MLPKNIPEFLLLSELIDKLKDKEYYRVFAKTLLMTCSPSQPIPADEELVHEMFQFFIKDKQLNIYYNHAPTTLENIESKISSRTEDNINQSEKIGLSKIDAQNQIWKNEIYAKVNDLKKLYANKCIVLPNSLFISKDPSSKR